MTRLAEVDPEHALKTYRYLRIGMAGAVALIGVSVAWEVVRAFLAEGWCMQTSLSAYYYTPVRAIFVGALMAIGLALIVIKDRPVQDTALNVAGMLAPVVALVPTTKIGGCWSIVPDPDPLVKGELAEWVLRNIENNFFALAVAGVVGLLVAISLAVRDKRAGRTTEQTDRNMRISARISGAILLIFVVLMLIWDDFNIYAHHAAAISMFVALNVAVIATARWEKSERKLFRLRYKHWYVALAWLMSAGGLVVWGLAALTMAHHVLVIEAWEIVMFAAFWLVQTVDNWHEELGPASAPASPSPT